MVDAGTVEASTAAQLLATMRLIREFESRVLLLRGADEIYGTVHPYIGQEAVATGVGAHLTDGDAVVSNHRGHGHCLAKGADPGRMLAELLGRSDGQCRGKGGSMHVAEFDRGILGANGIVGAGAPIAVGAAWAATATEGQRAVTAVYFGDGALGQGVIYESFNIASLWQLPVLFVCENNGWAVDTPATDSLAGQGIASIASSFGIAAAEVDGNDVLDVYVTAGRLIEAMRSGGGPSLLHARTYRKLFHSWRSAHLPDHRPDGEAWLERDPISTFESRLESSGTLDSDQLAAIAQQTVTTIDAAVEFARNSPPPDVSTAFDDMFADLEPTCGHCNC